MKMILIVALVACLPLGAMAQEFDKGLAAEQSGDFATAFQEWRPLAEQGDASAQNNLGVICESGQGVPQNYVSAHMWYHIASANCQKDSGTWREDIAIKMMSANISEAQRRARV